MQALPMVASLASTGMGIFGGLMEGQGQQAAYAHRAAQAERQRQAALVQADQTSSSLQNELAETLGNINAIRASSGVMHESPTGLAIDARESKESDRQRRIKVGNIKSQAQQLWEDQKYYAYAGDQAMRSSMFGTFGRALSSLSGLGGRFGSTGY